MKRILRLGLVLVMLAGTVAGIVMVLPSGGSATKVIEEVPLVKSIQVLCKTEWDCYTDEIIRAMGNGDVEGGVDLLIALDEATDGISGACHQIAHGVGSRAYGKFGDAALITRAETCDWGYGHGAMVAASQELKTSEFLSTFSNYCARIMGTEAAAGCTHGIGHALAESHQTVKIAAEVCGGIGGKFDKTRHEYEWVFSKTHVAACIEGWAMQSGGSYPWAEMATPDEADKICAGIDGIQRAVCSSMSVRNWVILVTDAKVQLERLAAFSDWCQPGRTGNTYGVECGRYLGEASDDLLFNSSVPFDGPAIAAGVEKYCSGVAGRVCTESLVVALLNRLMGTAVSDDKGDTTEKIRSICTALERAPWSAACDEAADRRLGLVTEPAEPITSLG